MCLYLAGGLKREGGREGEREKERENLMGVKPAKLTSFIVRIK